MVAVAAVSDVHSPLYLREFLANVGLRVRECSLFLLAGDMILRSRVSQLAPVLRGINRTFSGQIIATLGNEEHDAVKGSLMREYQQVRWLDDSDIMLEIEGRKVRIVGTRGSLAEPTSWQKAHLPDILAVYSKRVQLVRGLLERRNDDDVVVLLSHYAPVQATTQGEPEHILPVLTDSRMEKVVKETSPDIVIHGHAHNATTLSANIYGARVFNVAFPARRSTTVIDLW
jgi:Icc-related predicted phosphoesterase